MGKEKENNAYAYGDETAYRLWSWHTTDEEFRKAACAAMAEDAQRLGKTAIDWEKSDIRMQSPQPGLEDGGFLTWKAPDGVNFRGAREKFGRLFARIPQPAPQRGTSKGKFAKKFQKKDSSKGAGGKAILQGKRHFRV